MHERISRIGDEGVYRPRIHSSRIQQLEEIREQTGIPVTVLLDSAIELFTSENTRSILWTASGKDRRDAMDMDLEQQLEALAQLGDLTIRRVPTMDTKPAPYDMQSGWQIETMVGFEPRKFEDKNLCRAIEDACTYHADKIEEVLAPF